MDKRRKHSWGKMRVIGKYRYLFIFSSMLGGILISIKTLVVLYPDGSHLNFLSFLGEAVFTYIFSLLLGIIAWALNEREYKKGNETSGGIIK